MTGKSDPNPTVILEAMAWGLIPIATKGSGYTEDDGGNFTKWGIT